MDLVKSNIEEMMKSIFNSRLTYAMKKWGRDINMITEYCKDWVANYELSDYM